MKKWVGVIKGFFSPRPTLFDLCVIVGLAGIKFVPGYLNGFYFCFFAVLVTVIGFYRKSKRNFTSPALTLLSLLALSGLFLHSFIYSQNSVTFTYLNFYLLFEGFIYVFCGCLLFYTLVCKATNLRLYYIALPVCLWNFINYSIAGGRCSLIVAMVMGFVVYLIVKKRYQIASLLTLIGLNFALWNIDWLIMKWSCRIPIWHDLIFSKVSNIGILQHPFIGHGYNKLVLPDGMMFSTQLEGYLFQHNDYLNIMNILGILAVIPIAMFMWQVLKIVKRSWYLAPIVGIAILCFVQMTIFSGDKALAIVVFLALAVIENERGNTWTG